MKKLKIRENDNTIYVTLLFDHENIAHQISITINPHYLHCEAVPPSFASKEFFKKLSQILGEPAEKPRIRESYSDCGEEAGSLFC